MAVILISGGDLETASKYNNVRQFIGCVDSAARIVTGKAGTTAEIGLAIKIVTSGAQKGAEVARQRQLLREGGP